MKITTLGVSGAFSSGKPIMAVLEETLKDQITSFNGDFIPKDYLIKLVELESKKYFNPNWQSNFLIEFNQPSIRNGGFPYRLLLDAGGDIKNSLAYQNLQPHMIDGVYITHCHNDHIGGMECLGLTTFFNPFYSRKKTEWLNGEYIINKIFTTGLENVHKISDGMKMEVYGQEDVLNDLWKTLVQGFSTLQDIPKIDFETFFTKKIVTEDKPIRFIDNEKIWEGKIIKSDHVISGTTPMPSYGIMFSCSDGQKIFFPSDSKAISESDEQYKYYKECTTAFIDCETTPNKSGIHGHIDEHRKNEDSITKKEILYHYQTEPDNSDGKFKAIAKIGDVWEF